MSIILYHGPETIIDIRCVRKKAPESVFEKGFLQDSASQFVGDFGYG